MSDHSLQTSFWLMVALQTISAVDMPGKGDRKLPAPKAYVSIIVAWIVLDVAADAGMERAANAVGWVIVLAGLIIGPFGKIVTTLFTNTAKAFSNAPATGSGASTTVTPPPNQFI